jgi:hypothetical protein
VGGADIDRFFDCLAGINCPDCNRNGAPDDCDGIQPLRIVKHPESFVGCEDELVTLKVTTNTPPLRYQWRRNGEEFPGAIGDTLKVRGVGEYDVVVSDDCTTLVSNVATVTLRELPHIDHHPTSRILCRGEPFEIGVAATGWSLDYQWYKDGVAIPGATSSAFAIAAVDHDDAGSYDVDVWNQCARVRSRSAQLTVPTVITTQPAGQTVCIGDRTVFVVGAVGPNLYYQWRKEGEPILGAVASSYVIFAADPGDAGDYDVVVTGQCCREVSQPATLIVEPCP